MRNRQHTLLAGVAALALVAGTGFASAQGAPKEPSGAMQMKGTSSSSQQKASPNSSSAQLKRDEGGATAKNKDNASRAAQGTSPGAEHKGATTKNTAPQQGQNATAPNRSAENGRSTKTEQGRNQAQETNRSGRNDQERNRAAQNREERGNNRAAQRQDERGKFTAQSQEQKHHNNTAERQERGLKGLQGNTTVPMQDNDHAQRSGSAGAGADIHLSQKQRSRIRETVIASRDAPRVDHLNFDLRVGAAIPRGDVHVVAVPESLVRIQPRWHGYLYFVYEDEVVIVNPRDMRVVAVLNV